MTGARGVRARDLHRGVRSIEAEYLFSARFGQPARIARDDHRALRYRRRRALEEPAQEVDDVRKVFPAIAVGVAVRRGAILPRACIYTEEPRRGATLEEMAQQVDGIGEVPAAIAVDITVLGGARGRARNTQAPSRHTQTQHHGGNQKLSHDTQHLTRR